MGPRGSRVPRGPKILRSHMGPRGHSIPRDPRGIRVSRGYQYFVLKRCRTNSLKNTDKLHIYFH
jgi:hypothetical protein